MLDLDSVAAYLLERGLLHRDAVVDGSLLIVDRSRRNVVFIVTAEIGRSFVVKIGRREHGFTVAREAAILGLLAGHKAVSAMLPSIALDDRAADVLVLETAASTHDLVRHHGEHARGRFSQALARAAGTALARLHALPAATLANVHPPVERAWGLRVHDPDLATIRAMSAGELELVALVQRSGELCAALECLRTSSFHQVPIHGDVRWDNCLALAAPAGTRRRIALIDWELAGAGDRCVDVGAFLAEYLRAWAQSIPIVDPRDPGRLIEHALCPLARMRPALLAFWVAYARGSGEPASRLPDLLRRATQFSAIRLLEALFEETRVRSRPRPTALFELQLATNILRRPDEAAARLLGLGGALAPES